jgi:hypothetical protein
MNGEDGHLVSIGISGKESEQGTDINFLGRNYRGVSAFAGSALPELATAHFSDTSSS